MKIDWKRKLSSRKFWAGVAGFVSANAAAFGVGDNITARVVLIITAVGALCVYMLSEGMADSGNINQQEDSNNE
ncbi:hypothetical protein FACS1894217_07330 [Clostridia bacterium]|nr:hypothetical protein FACS1894208_09270 [Clostridia bacterium]GHV07153.1 hypothetical protein FACS1894217_07330 [Clostridia bacterium]